MYVNSPLYISIWLSSIYFSGGYDKPVSLRRILRGVFVGTIILSAVYAFLNDDYRSSRMLIILGALWTGVSLVGSRLVFHFVENRNFRLSTEGGKNLLIVGEKVEALRVKALLNQAQVLKNIIGIVAPHDTLDFETYLGSEEDLIKITHLFNIQEIIFCSKDIPNQRIIAHMQGLGNRIEYRILPEGGSTIIGSSDKNTTGELYASSTHFKIASPTNKRNKRVMDVFICFIILVFIPLIIITLRFNLIILKNIASVLIGKKTWIGYYKNSDKNLPKLKEGVFSPVLEKDILNESALQKLNYFYAKNYDVWLDLTLVWKAWRGC